MAWGRPLEHVNRAFYVAGGLAGMYPCGKAARQQGGKVTAGDSWRRQGAAVSLTGLAHDWWGPWLNLQGLAAAAVRRAWQPQI